MKLILLTSGEYDSYEVDGLFNIPDASYTEIQSLRAKAEELRIQGIQLPRFGTSITSISLDAPPPLPELTEEEHALRLRVGNKLRELHLVRRGCYVKIREIIQFGEVIEFEEIN